MPGKVKVKIVAGRNLPVMDRSNDTTDAYVEVKLGSTTFKTDVCRKSLNPQWNSEWFRFEMDDLELQDEPLQIRLMDHDTYSANDAIGKVYLDLNPLLLTSAKGKDSSGSGKLISGWIPVYDTMHGIRGEVNLVVKVELFSDLNKFRQSSCGVMFFFTQAIPDGYFAHSLHGFVEELVVNDDPEYQWIDKIRTPRASNEARQTLFSKLSGEVQRRVGLKALELGGNAVVGYRQCFDLEGESGIVVRGIGTAATLIKQYESQLSPSGLLESLNASREFQSVDDGLLLPFSSHPFKLSKASRSKRTGSRVPTSTHSMPETMLLNYPHYPNNNTNNKSSSFYRNHSASSASSFTSRLPHMLPYRMPRLHDIDVFTSSNLLLASKPVPNTNNNSSSSCCSSSKDLLSHHHHHDVITKSNNPPMLAVQNLPAQSAKSPQVLRRADSSFNNNAVVVVVKPSRVSSSPGLDPSSPHRVLDKDPNNLDFSEAENVIIERVKFQTGAESLSSLSGVDTGTNNKDEDEGVDEDEDEKGVNAKENNFALLLMNRRPRGSRKKERYSKSSLLKRASMNFADSKRILGGSKGKEKFTDEIVNFFKRKKFLLGDKSETSSLSENTSPYRQPKSSLFRRRAKYPGTLHRCNSESFSLGQTSLDSLPSIQSELVFNDDTDSNSLESLPSNIINISPVHTLLKVPWGASGGGMRKGSSSGLLSASEDVLAGLGATSMPLLSVPSCGDDRGSISSANSDKSISDDGSTAARTCKLADPSLTAHMISVVKELGYVHGPPDNKHNKSLRFCISGAEALLILDEPNECRNKTDMTNNITANNYNIEHTGSSSNIITNKDGKEQFLELGATTSDLETIIIPPLGSHTSSSPCTTSSRFIPEHSSSSIYERSSVPPESHDDNSTRGPLVVSLGGVPSKISIDSSSSVISSSWSYATTTTNNSSSSSSLGVVGLRQGDHDLMGASTTTAASAPPSDQKEADARALRPSCSNNNKSRILPSHSRSLSCSSSGMNFNNPCLSVLSVRKPGERKSVWSDTESTALRVVNSTNNDSRNTTMAATSDTGQFSANNMRVHDHFYNKDENEPSSSSLCSHSSVHHESSYRSPRRNTTATTTTTTTRAAVTIPTCLNSCNNNNTTTTTTNVTSTATITEANLNVSLSSNTNASSTTTTMPLTPVASVTKSVSSSNGSSASNGTTPTTRPQSNSVSGQGSTNGGQPPPSNRAGNQTQAKQGATTPAVAYINRRSSESDLSSSPKPISTTAASGATVVASSTTHGKTLTFAPMPTRRQITADHFEMLEYPFITLNQLPAGFIQHLGGTVSARSVKLLERISNLDEPESRDSWWTEIRMEIRSHARSIGCNIVLGYEEQTTMCDDVCVLSASGTAALVSSTIESGEATSNIIKVPGGDCAVCVGLQTRTEKDKAQPPTTESVSSQQNGCTKCTAKVRHSSSESNESNCALCHIPYNESSVPFPVKMTRCLLCRKGKVPDILLATIDLPAGLQTYGKSCLIQAQVFRPKKDCKGEISAKEVSDSLPFLEYELHRRLINKLKVRGMNAVFALQVQICLGEKLMVGLATGTAVFVSCLPPPTVPKISAGNLKTDSQKVIQFQKVVQEVFEKNREVYNLKNTVPVQLINGNQSVSSDGEESDEDLPDLDLAAGNKDTYVLEVDDAEDIDIIQVLIDPSPELGFYMNNINLLHEFANYRVSSQQMFTQVWRCRISPLITLRQFTNYFDKLLQAVAFKLRRNTPCVLSKLRYRVELPEQDEMQLSIIGLAVKLEEIPKALLTVENGVNKPTESNELTQSAGEPGGTSNQKLSKAVSTTSTTQGGNPSITVPDSITAYLKAATGMAYAASTGSARASMDSGAGGRGKGYPRPMPVRGRPKCIEITPLSHIPGAKIDKYLGNLNFFFIRETTSIREIGGLNGFVHSFIAEVLAIVRAHVAALGGNAMVSYFMTELALLHNPHKNQGQCLVNVGGDVVLALYPSGLQEG